jgi:hypothetical protein
VRIRLVLVGLIAIVLLVHPVAWARCLEQPFDEVVRSSDAVLVATVAHAGVRGPHRTGVVVRLDVEQVLKGSAEDGRRVSVAPCGPAMAGELATAYAEGLIGTRGLFLLDVNPDGTASSYSEITTPQNMTLDEQIARAREVLGVPQRRPVIASVAWVAAVVVVGALAVVAVRAIRRSRHG